MEQTESTEKQYARYRKSIGGKSRAVHPRHFAEVNKLKKPAISDRTDVMVAGMRDSGASWQAIYRMLGSR
jgi:hypothetical protein